MLRDDFNLPVFKSILGNFKINLFWKTFSGQVIFLNVQKVVYYAFVLLKTYKFLYTSYECGAWKSTSKNLVQKKIWGSNLGPVDYKPGTISRRLFKQCWEMTLFTLFLSILRAMDWILLWANNVYGIGEFSYKIMQSDLVIVV